MNTQAMNKNMRRSMQRMFPLFVLPVFICFTFSFAVPFVQALYLSFCDFFIPKDAVWTGLSNYRTALLDISFWHSFLTTFAFAVVSILAINIPAYFIAYFLKDRFKCVSLFRTSFFIPNLIGGVVLGYIWSMLFDGVLRYFGTYLTSNAVFGFFGIVILVAWQQIGYMMIIYIAGLQAVPEELHEAAKIDGASKWQTLFKVTIPNVMPSITICTFLSLTNGFKLFDQNLALTGGQPFIIQPDGASIKTTEMLALNIFNTFYGSNSASSGQAQAKAVLFFILVASIGLIQLGITRKREVQQ